MNKTITDIPPVMLVVALFANVAHAQHSDIQFFYQAGEIEVITEANLGVATATMQQTGLFAQETENPGFNSELDESLGIGGGEQIVYNVLEGLRFWNQGFQSPNHRTELHIRNNGGATTVVSPSSGLLPGSFAPAANYIGAAEGNGDFHHHVDYSLKPLNAFDLPNPAVGAYGIKMTLSTSATGIADSDPFFIVFNLGLDATAFAEAVNDYAGLLDTLPGDFNGDGFVNLADYTIWRDNLGGSEDDGVLNGNGDGGLVEASDYTLWKQNFGSEANAVPVTQSTIQTPEPSWLGSMLLIILAGRFLHARLSLHKDQR